MAPKKHKRKRLKTRNKKSFQAQIYFFRQKKTPSSNSSHHIEPFDTKINCFNGQNHRQQQLSLSTLEFGESPSPLKKRLNMRKMKFSIKIKFLKIKRTNCLRANKMGDENKLLRQISKPPSISLVFFFYFSPLSFNSTLSP